MHQSFSESRIRSLSYNLSVQKGCELTPEHAVCLHNLVFFFRIRDVLHNLGNEEEVQEYKNYENNKKLYETVQKHTEGKAFSDWKTKVSNGDFT